MAAGVVNVVLAPPQLLLLQCPSRSKEGAQPDRCISFEVPAAAREQVWVSPTGAMWHADVVDIGTGVAAVLAMAALMAVLFRGRLALPAEKQE
jgi:hypothetical protein